jgi:long-chain acyl-CoA synthetase
MTDQISERGQEQQRPEFESMVHMLAHAAKEHPDHIAVISGDNEITFADYYACVAGLANNLIDMGARNERVIILKAN